MKSNVPIQFIKHIKSWRTRKTDRQTQLIKSKLRPSALLLSATHSWNNVNPMLNQTVITVRIIEVIMNSTCCILKHFSFQLNNQAKSNAMQLDRQNFNPYRQRKISTNSYTRILFVHNKDMYSTASSTNACMHKHIQRLTHWRNSKPHLKIYTNNSKIKMKTEKYPALSSFQMLLFPLHLSRSHSDPKAPKNSENSHSINHLPHKRKKIKKKTLIKQHQHQDFRKSSSKPYETNPRDQSVSEIIQNSKWSTVGQLFEISKNKKENVARFQAPVPDPIGEEELCVKILFWFLQISLPLSLSLSVLVFQFYTFLIFFRWVIKLPGVTCKWRVGNLNAKRNLALFVRSLCIRVIG